jgi:hypothetical protein
VFRLNDEGITVPAFSFEKIPAPPRIVAPAAAVVAAKPRGRFARLVDRLVVLRQKSTEPRSQRPVRDRLRKRKSA